MTQRFEIVIPAGHAIRESEVLRAIAIHCGVVPESVRETSDGGELLTETRVAACDPRNTYAS